MQILCARAEARFNGGIRYYRRCRVVRVRRPRELVLVSFELIRELCLPSVYVHSNTRNARIIQLGWVSHESVRRSNRITESFGRGQKKVGAGHVQRVNDDRDLSGSIA